MPNVKADPDVDIILRIVSGDVEAYAEIMQRYEPKLLRYVTYLIHDSQAARDVVQITFIKAYQNLRGFDLKYKFSSWIYRIAHNEAMNSVKSANHMTDEDISESPDVGYEPTIADTIDEDVLKEDVKKCVSQLDPKYKDVVQLVYFEHMKYEEVSDVLHVPTSTVGVWLSRAKAQLKRICEKKGIRR